MSKMLLTFKKKYWGWGFSSVVERLPRKRKALGSVPSSEKKEPKKKKILIYFPRMCACVRACMRKPQHWFVAQVDFESMIPS